MKRSLTSLEKKKSLDKTPNHQSHKEAELMHPILPQQGACGGCTKLISRTHLKSEKQSWTIPPISIQFHRNWLLQPQPLGYCSNTAAQLLIQVSIHRDSPFPNSRRYRSKAALRTFTLYKVRNTEPAVCYCPVASTIFVMELEALRKEYFVMVHRRCFRDFCLTTDYLRIPWRSWKVLLDGWMDGCG